jgi:hypothetical protein
MYNVFDSQLAIDIKKIVHQCNLDIDQEKQHRYHASMNQCNLDIRQSGLSPNIFTFQWHTVPYNWNTQKASIRARLYRWAI